MKLQPLPLILILVVGLFGCKNDQNKFTVIGHFQNMPKQTVLLEEIGINDMIVIDSAQSNEKGEFELSGTSMEEGLYRLHFSESNFILLAIERGTVKVSGDWGQMDHYMVSGSNSSVELQKFIEQLRLHMRDFNTLQIVMDSLQVNGKDSLFQEAREELLDRNIAFTQYVETYADTTSSLPNAIFAARILNPKTEAKYLSALNASLAKRFPNSNLSRSFSEHLTQVIGSTASESQRGIVVGSDAPLFELPDQDGVPVYLKDYKGKYVLVDFWASWCGPCRAENPNVVAAYKKFKSPSFEIIGISLDDDKAKWIKAIAEDKLAWIQVSDLKGWESVAARSYNIQSIPSNFLLDPTGKVVAVNLRGSELENKLVEVFKREVRD